MVNQLLTAKSAPPPLAVLSAATPLELQFVSPFVTGAFAPAARHC